MALLDIQKKIEGEFREKADKVLAEARETVATIKAEANAEIEAVKAKFDKQLTEEGPEIARRANIVAGLDVNRLLLGARHELLNRAYDGGLKELASMSDGDYCAFCADLLKKAVVSGDEEVVVSPTDTRLTQSWLDEQNKAGSWKLTRVEDKAVGTDGGFLLRRGSVSENCRFETLVRWLKEDLEPELAQRLFSKS